MGETGEPNRMKAEWCGRCSKGEGSRCKSCSGVAAICACVLEDVVPDVDGDAIHNGGRGVSDV